MGNQGKDRGKEDNSALNEMSSRLGEGTYFYRVIDIGCVPDIVLGSSDTKMNGISSLSSRVSQIRYVDKTRTEIHVTNIYQAPEMC